jgi:Tol biopolymer transport system component
VGYGGGTFAQHGDVLVYAARTKLVGLNTNTGEQWNVSPDYEGVAAPAFSPCGRYVAFLAETSSHANVLLADVRGHDLPIKLSADPWYAFNPAFSPGGERLAWMEWGEWDMPWDEARLVVADLARPLGDCDLAAQALPVHPRFLGKPRVALSSPQFSPDGQWLAYLSDETGWRSIWVLPAGAADFAEARRLDTGPGEVGAPEWLPGHVRARWA